MNENREKLWQCAQLILPWLPPPDLASISLTCKYLHQLVQSITKKRSADASRALEKYAIPFFNNVDDRPYSYFIYTPFPVIGLSSEWQSNRQFWGGNSQEKYDVLSFRSAETLFDDSYGCVCQNSCIKSECLCSIFEARSQVELIRECGSNCLCGIECVNRITQRKISVALKIVRDLKKGWGLYADQFIQCGEFICEYAGELLTTEEAKRRQQKYDALARNNRIPSSLLVIREHLPSGKACLRINIDATKVGNVARFINHSCDGGNLSTMLVRKSGELLPHVCFFASRDIQVNEEICFSYGDARIVPNCLPCFCGSSCCLGVLPSERT